LDGGGMVTKSKKQLKLKRLLLRRRGRLSRVLQNLLLEKLNHQKNDYILLESGRVALKIIVVFIFSTFFVKKKLFISNFSDWDAFPFGKFGRTNYSRKGVRVLEIQGYQSTSPGKALKKLRHHINLAARDNLTSLNVSGEKVFLYWEAVCKKRGESISEVFKYTGLTESRTKYLISSVVFQNGIPIAIAVALKSEVVALNFLCITSTPGASRWLALHQLICYSQFSGCTIFRSSGIFEINKSSYDFQERFGFKTYNVKRKIN
jgi:hypothetical protein